MALKLFLVIVLSGILLVVADEKEHVHFKIHVPEVIKHHYHTHTVLVHIHHPGKKKEHKKKAYLYNDYEDFDSYNTYNQHSGYAEGYGGEEDQNISKDQLTTQYPSLVTQKNSQGEPPIPFYDDYAGGDYQEIKNPSSSSGSGSGGSSGKKSYEGGVTGYPYVHNQYANHNGYQVTESIEEPPPGSYENKNYEESHKSGGEIQHGHMYQSNLNNYYNNKIEESSENALNEASEEHYRYPGSNYITKQIG